MTAPSFPLVSVASLRALVPSSLGDDALREIIDREEAYVARELWWPGGLGDEVTQTFYVNDPSLRGMYVDTAFFGASDRGRSLTFGWVTADVRSPLWLLRPTRSVTVVDNDIELPSTDIRLLRRGTFVERASGGWQGPRVTVSYTPTDTREVARAVIELCRLTLTETGYASEQIGEYRYQKRTDKPDETRKSLIRSLRTHWPVGSVRMAGSNEDRRVGGMASS